MLYFFFFKQKTAYEMRISDWSSDVCSSDLDALLNSDEHSAHCRTESHRAAANPLRRDGQLAAVHLIEYGAQAMAVHGGWMARQNRAAGDGAGARPGVLAAVRQFEENGGAAWRGRVWEDV